MAMRFAITLVLLSWLAAPASAGIYKCVHPDSSVIFVSDPDDCAAGALAPHELNGAYMTIQNSKHSPAEAKPEAAEPPPSPDAAREATAPAKPAAATSGEDPATLWMRKRTDAERELALIARNVAEWDKIVTWCHRGGSLAVEDDVGASEPYDCGQAIEAHVEMTARRDALRLYLEEGLREECRRAECLPGWIR